MEKEKMNKNWVFKNSPFEMLAIAAKRLFPDIEYEAYLDSQSRPEENGQKAYGFTDFGEDGTIAIFVDSELSVNNAVEIFAHELAHAAVGVEHDHDDVWGKAFEELFTEYNKIGDEMFGGE